jgi:hypothetical protein
VCKAKSIGIISLLLSVFSFFIFQAKSAATDDDSPGIENSAIFLSSLPLLPPFPTVCAKKRAESPPCAKLKLDRSAE